MLFDYGFLSSPDDAYGDDALLAESFGLEAALPLKQIQRLRLGGRRLYVQGCHLGSYHKFNQIENENTQDYRLYKGSPKTFGPTVLAVRVPTGSRVVLLEKLPRKWVLRLGLTGEEMCTIPFHTDETVLGLLTRCLEKHDESFSAECFVRFLYGNVVFEEELWTKPVREAMAAMEALREEQSAGSKAAPEPKAAPAASQKSKKKKKMKVSKRPAKGSKGRS